MNCINIVKGTENDFSRLLAVWESAVKATHDFLDNEDFVYYQSRMMDYLRLVDLYVYKDGDGEIIGFMGVSDTMIEMLFVDAASRGRGVGRELLNYATGNLNIYNLDVNEQNTQAVGFYLKMGFKISGRSPVDNEGKQYPLLHLHYVAG